MVRVSESLAELSSLVVEEFYGEYPGYVFRYILDQTRVSLKSILQNFVKWIPGYVVHNALALLVSQNLVSYSSASAPGVTHYQANLTFVLALIRHGRNLGLLRERFGQHAASIASCLQLNGQALKSDVLEAIAGQPHQDVEDDGKVTVDMSSTLGKRKRDDAGQSWKALADSGFLEKLDDVYYFMPLGDFVWEAEHYLRKTDPRFKNKNISGPKITTELKMATGQLMKDVRAGRMNWFEMMEKFYNPPEAKEDPSKPPRLPRFGAGRADNPEDIVHYRALYEDLAEKKRIAREAKRNGVALGVTTSNQITKPEDSGKDGGTTRKRDRGTQDEPEEDVTSPKKRRSEKPKDNEDSTNKSNKEAPTASSKGQEKSKSASIVDQAQNGVIKQNGKPVEIISDDEVDDESADAESHVRSTRKLRNGASKPEVNGSVKRKRVSEPRIKTPNAKSSNDTAQANGNTTNANGVNRDPVHERDTRKNEDGDDDQQQKRRKRNSTVKNATPVNGDKSANNPVTLDIQTGNVSTKGGEIDKFQLFSDENILALATTEQFSTVLDVCEQQSGEVLTSLERQEYTSAWKHLKDAALENAVQHQHELPTNGDETKTAERSRKKQKTKRSSASTVRENIDAANESDVAESEQRDSIRQAEAAIDEYMAETGLELSKDEKEFYVAEWKYKQDIALTEREQELFDGNIEREEAELDALCEVLDVPINTVEPLGAKEKSSLNAWRFYASVFPDEKSDDEDVYAPSTELSFRLSPEKLLVAHRSQFLLEQAEKHLGAPETQIYAVFLGLLEKKLARCADPYDKVQTMDVDEPVDPSEYDAFDAVETPWDPEEDPSFLPAWGDENRSPTPETDENDEASGEDEVGEEREKRREEEEASHPEGQAYVTCKEIVAALSPELIELIEKSAKTEAIVTHDDHAGFSSDTDPSDDESDWGSGSEDNEDARDSSGTSRGATGTDSDGFEITDAILAEENAAWEAEEARRIAEATPPPPDSLVDRVGYFMRYIAEKPPHFASPLIKFNAQKWTIDFPVLFKHLHKQILLEYIEARYGGVANLIVRTLDSRKQRYDYRQLEYYTMLDRDSMWATLAVLGEDDIIEIQMVVKEGVKHLSENYWLYYWTPNPMRMRLIENCYKAQARLLERLKDRRRAIKQTAERARLYFRGQPEPLLRVEEQQAKDWRNYRKMERAAWLSIQRLDYLVMVLRDFVDETPAT